MGRPKTGRIFDYKTWYEANKEKIAKRRKERYDSDPQYKENIIKRNKTYRKTKSKNRRKKAVHLLRRLNEVTKVEIIYAI